MATLTLERKDQINRTRHVGSMALTPPVSEDYWTYRVRLTEAQSIVGIPKFRTIGIGFAVEEDRNTNLPYTCGASEIYEHIEHTRGDDSISREDCVRAIEMIQAAARADREGSGESA